MIGMHVRKRQHGQAAVTELPQNATSGPACGGVHQHIADQVDVDGVGRESTKLPDMLGEFMHRPFSKSRNIGGHDIAGLGLGLEMQFDAAGIELT
jgi:hypothetical protein